MQLKQIDYAVKLRPEPVFLPQISSRASFDANLFAAINTAKVVIRSLFIVKKDRI